MKILILGGCGFVGTKLVKNIINLKKDYKIKVIDTQWFGNNLKKNKNLNIIKKDIRELNLKDFKNIDVVIHLANIANDPSVELLESLSWDVNVLSTNKIMDLCVKSKVKKFIYASSGSVYGIKKEKKVTEDLDLVPISTYNKTKMIAERIIFSYKNKIKTYCIRPATVCGFSDRLRLDLSVNMLTLQALKTKKIKVFGGSQIRPNIHIDDLTRLYILFIEKNINPGVYNAGFENLSILKIAKIIQKYIPSKLIITKSNDNRSYRLDSSKILKIGFKPKYTINDAIEELIYLYNNNKIKVIDKNFNIKWMDKNKYK